VAGTATAARRRQSAAASTGIPRGPAPASRVRELHQAPASTISRAIVRSPGAAEAGGTRVHHRVAVRQQPPTRRASHRFTPSDSMRVSSSRAVSATAEAVPFAQVPADSRRQRAVRAHGVRLQQRRCPREVRVHGFGQPLFLNAARTAGDGPHNYVCDAAQQQHREDRAQPDERPQERRLTP
jgi:hypothetical protein